MKLPQKKKGLWIKGREDREGKETRVHYRNAPSLHRNTGNAIVSKGNKGRIQL